MDLQRSDAMLMEILQEQKTITGFLDRVFGFLRRNTDFYHTKRDAADIIGFPKGMRDQILYGAMLRYDPECWLQTMTAESGISGSGEDAPPAIQEISVQTEENRSSTKSSKAIKIPGFEPVDFKNGAAFEHHCWSQTLSDLEIHVQLPREIKTYKQLCIDIKAQQIKVSSRASPEHVILEGLLSQRIKHTDALWSIEDGRLLISCDKAKERWWERLFDGDDDIDIKKLDCERYIDELPQDSQLAIEKLRVQQMTADQQQSSLQATDPEQAKTLERLRIAWDAEGSPFKGQPFDPSVVRMS
ncbi:nudC domain-containing protein 3 isoform X2 [Drosophila grimshawi]|uniref:Nuclear migration protein nudC n=1 Tax=Drosophila grimshawi TaxID=7222 RepID=B4J1P9_DROGR|nr:nudC domain-containing protein 3 isoform X2 [Drosophila grimshawi]EDV96969.1 GH16573 [Drosophila grimshawi]